MIESNGIHAREPKKIVATIGAFDGIHQGHRHVIDILKSKALEMGQESAVITFSPHPRLVIEGEGSKLMLLTTKIEQSRQLSECGVDHIMHLAFDKELQALTAREFIDLIVISKLNISTLLVGYNHRIGSDRVLVSSLIEEYQSLSIIPLERLDVDSLKVSSTIIRSEISHGDISTANSLLGYNYTIVAKIDSHGRVVELDKRKIIPSPGRYKALFNGAEIVLNITNNTLIISQVLPLGVDYNRLHIIEIVKKKY